MGSVACDVETDRRIGSLPRDPNTGFAHGAPEPCGGEIQIPASGAIERLVQCEPGRCLCGHSEGGENEDRES